MNRFFFLCNGTAAAAGHHRQISNSIWWWKVRAGCFIASTIGALSCELRHRDLLPLGLLISTLTSLKGAWPKQKKTQEEISMETQFKYSTGREEQQNNTWKSFEARRGIVSPGWPFFNVQIINQMVKKENNNNTRMHCFVRPNLQEP